MATYKVDLPEGGFVRFEAPDDASDEALQAAAQKRYAQHQKNLAAETEKARKEFEPTSGMSGFDKAAANVGAGMANLGTGVRALGTKMFGSDEDKAAMDAEVLEKRRLDEQLANKTTGGAALQLAGEIAPTLVIPAGGFASAAGRVLPKALAGRLGMQALAKGGSTIADASLAGGVSGALAPTTSDESTLGRIAAGAVLGGAVPFVGAKVGETISRLNPWGSGEKAAARVLGEQLGQGGGDAVEKASALAQQIRELPGMQADVASSGARRAGADMGAGGFEAAAGDAGAAAFDPALAAARRSGVRLETAGARPGGDIPLSTAAQLQNPELAWLEVGSRARNAANWSKADQDYAEGLAKSLRSATAEGGEIGKRIKAKNENWNANMGEAIENANPEIFADHVQALQNHVEDWLAHDPERFDAPVRKVYEQLRKDLAEAGEGFNPRDMQVIRRNFNGKANPTSQSVYKTAPRESTAIRDVIGRLDSALEETTGGKWTGVKSGYARDAGAVEEARSAQKLYDKYYDEAGRPIGTGQGIAGDLPNISEAGFSRATTGEKYSKAAQAEIDAMQDAIKAKNIVQRVKTSGTGGGGSATAPTWYAAQDTGAFGKALADVIRKVPLVGQGGMEVLEGAGRLANVNREKAIAKALQDPREMLALLERIEASGQPLTASQQALMRTLRGGAGGVAMAAQHP